MKKKKRSKQPPKKIHLVFDERERREFLTGFQKRKRERQKKAQEKLLQEAREEKRRLKAEKREILQRLLGDKPVPGSAADEGNEEEPVTYDLPDHTVTVTSLECSDLYGDVRIGQNQGDGDEEEDDDNGIGDEIERGRTTDTDKQRLKALDRQMGDCSVQLRAALHKDKKERGKMRRIKLRTTKRAKLARKHRL
uniref:Nucleolar protein 12 n=1 Tax=Amblyomma triste TaxID=251400 RepID=A0A023GI93_AMBTT